MIDQEDQRDGTDGLTFSFAMKQLPESKIF